MAIITGAGSGFGERLAKRLAPLGVKMVLCDINEKEGNRVADEIKAKYGPIALFKKTNVANNDDTKAMFQAAKERFGDIATIVILNAGIPERTDFYADETDDWQSQLDVNIKPVVLGTRIAIKEMVENKQKGVILATASLAGLYPQGRGPVCKLAGRCRDSTSLSNLSPFVDSAAKAFVVHWVRTLAFLDQPYGIRVNAICPSYSPTNIQKISRVGATSEITDKVTTGRDGRATNVSMIHPESVIDAFMHGIQDESIAGQAIRITPERGIEVQYMGKKPPLKLKDLTSEAERARM